MSDSPGTSEGPTKVFGAIMYECERCGTKQSLEDLSLFPEIRCKNCGYRSLKKVGRTAPKRLDAV